MINFWDKVAMVWVSLVMIGVVCLLGVALFTAVQREGFWMFVTLVGGSITIWAFWRLA